MLELASALRASYQAERDRETGTRGKGLGGNVHGEPNPCLIERDVLPIQGIGAG